MVDLAPVPAAPNTPAGGSNGAGALATPTSLSSLPPPLRPSDLLRGAHLVVIGGTGFLGKVWVAMLLHDFPEVAHVHLVVRPKKGQTAEERFWSQIATSPTFDPLREKYAGSAFEAFLREKITPVAGDVVHRNLGLTDEVVAALRGRCSAVVNVAGVVDFSPPIDEALEVNAFGVQNLVALARELGAPVLHTSTCFVAGKRSGVIEEDDPRAVPFPRARLPKLLGTIAPDASLLEQSHWDPEREIAECLDLVKMARHRSEDAFRQSAFLDQAKANLAARGEPCRGAALDDELAKVKRKFVEGQLVDAGTERARFWGWTNIYTYTKSIGEQVLAASGVPFTIVRPAIVESASRFPFVGWNEGINTSAPYIFMSQRGQIQIPGGADVNLDLIPVDMVASGMIAALAELLDGRARAVYQLGSSDVNPCVVARYVELCSLYKRKMVFEGKRTALFDHILARFETLPLTKKEYEAHGAHKVADAMQLASSVLGAFAIGPLAAVAKPASNALAAAARQERKTAHVIDLFVPFTAESSWIYSCANTRAALDRMPADERAKFFWEPEKIDWRQWLFEVHIPGLEKWVFPLIDDKLNKEVKPLRAYDHLLDLVDEVGERHEHSLALSEAHPDGLTRFTYEYLRGASFAVAERLRALGVRPGDRVVLSGRNRPAWPIAYFGILRAGGVVVPVDPALEGPQMLNVVRSSAAQVALWDEGVAAKGGEAVVRAFPNLAVVDLASLEEISDGEAKDAAANVRGHVPHPEDVASLIYTSGTTGEPKGVMLSHKNFASLLAALAPIFPLGPRDRVLSVLPLHHTFEFTCGMLLPLMLGARIVYVRELTSDGLSEGFSKGRITAMAGVPALWQMLERRILAQVAEKGPLATRAFDMALELNRMLGKTTGMNAGRLFFGEIHEKFGGNVRHFISGGAALPRDTAKLFAGLGMPLSEGYGLTEASPVISVSKGSMRTALGQVGKPVPGVEVRIAAADDTGVGEILARGPNVMKGYVDDPRATNMALDEEGWLHTGDLGKIDGKGRLVIVGRNKDVIVGPSGENVYPDDVENLLAGVEGVKELCIVGLPDGSGGEKVACLAVPAGADAPDAQRTRAERHARAHDSLRAAFERLPRVARPTVVQLWDLELPRTATRKVKRPDVRAILEKLASAAAAPPDSTAGSVTAVRHAVATITNREPKTLAASTTLRGDLAIDSLLGLELAAALEAQVGRAIDGEALARCETVGDLEALVADGRQLARAESTAIEAVAEEPIRVPEPIQDATKRVLTMGQMAFYGKVMRPRVTGRAFIPHNRNTIVVANHSSHLDMGFVKYALGSYGDGLVSLAAQDYFFKGNSLRRTYIENFTNLAPFDRKGGLRQGLRIAGDNLDQGKTVLIFPEGTRSVDGTIQEFKPAAFHLALAHGVDILPVWIGGTYEAMRKGTRLPTKRDLVARIGPPLEIGELRRLTAGMKTAAAARKIAQIAESAVKALRDGRVLDLRSVEGGAEALPPVAEHPVTALIRELEQKFVPGRVDKATTFYFTLGADLESKFSMRIDPERVEFVPGKLDPADCVLKTTPEIFSRIVRDAYVPTPLEFMTGLVKSNDISLLLTFQKAFDLS